MILPYPRISLIHRNLALLMALLLGLSFLSLSNSAKVASETSRFVRPSSSRPLNKAEEQKVIQAYGKLPIYFVSNKGQLDERVKYYASGAGYNFYLTQDGVTYSFVKSKPNKANGPNILQPRGDLEKPKSQEAYALKIKFLGANPDAVLEGRHEQKGKVNYLMGNDPKKWRTNISTYSQVTYKNLYPGINLTYKGNQKRLKYEFVVFPNADYKNIGLVYGGADSLKLDKAGNLLVDTPWGELKDQKPYVYQLSNGQKVPVRSAFIIKGNTAGFSLDAYDPGLPLYIDPGLVYSTFIGGSTTDGGRSLALDASGNAYIAGFTYSTDFPTTAGAYNTSHNGNIDVFVTKLNPSGSALSYSTFIGGSGHDYDPSLVLDASGNAYLTGATYSSDFPTTAGAYDTSHNGALDVFFIKLSPSGSALSYSTFIGGSGYDYGCSLALDASGNAYLTGDTWSSDFPTTVGAYDISHNGGDGDVFVTKLNPYGSALSYSTFIGGSSYDAASIYYGGCSLALDASGNAYIAGYTESSDFPTTAGAYDTSHNGSGDVFVTKLNPSGSALSYSTFIGGSTTDGGRSLALDASGNAYITGFTYSTNFPTTAGAYDISHNGDLDVFVTKLDPSGSALSYSTFIGGSGHDFGDSLALDASGNAYLTGDTGSTDFPTTAGAYDTSYNGGSQDAFVTKLDVIAPTTTLETLPTSPDGTNGWFKTTPSITLTRDEPGTTYYEWDANPPPGDPSWNVYSGPINAPEGEHTLYYYSVDTAGNTETTKIQLFKVDTQPPTFLDSNQWTTNGPSGVAITSVVISPNYQADDTIFAGSQSSGVYKSTDRGASWTNVGLTGTGEIWPIAISPDYAVDETVFVGDYGYGVFKSTNGGSSWTQLSSGLTNTTVDSLAISPNYTADRTIFAGTWGDGVFKSTDGGASWTQTNSGLTNLVVTNLAISPNYTADRTIFAGTWGDGVFKSTDGGASWAHGPTYNIVVVMNGGSISPNYQTDSTIFAGTSDEGVLKSTDGGASWTLANAGLPTTNASAVAVSPNYATDNTVFAALPSYGVFKSTDGGTSWTEMRAGLTNMNVRNLAISPDYQTDRTVFAGTAGSGVFSYTEGPGINLPADGAVVNKPYPYFSWNASSDSTSGLAKYQLYIDSSLSRDNIVDWTAAVPSTALTNGSHSWFARAWDNAGNHRDSATRNVTLSSESGRIAFSSQRTGSSEIYIMNPDGSGQTRLTVNSVDDEDPAFSPDGSKIVFSARVGEYGPEFENLEVYVMNADGIGRTRLTYTDWLYWDMEPSFSPDGSRIVFRSHRDGGNAEIYTMNADGTGQTRLTGSPDSEQYPSFSPDGRRIVYASVRPPAGQYADICIMNADGSENTVLKTGAPRDSHPSFSPDGSKITFVSDNDGEGYEIYVMDVDGSNVSRLTYNSVNTYDWHPSFSPDGQKITFSSNRFYGSQEIMEIYVMDADGTDPTRLTDNSAAGFDVQDFYPTWGPGPALAPNDTTPPVTALSSSPSSPDGANGWFKTTPSITLSPNEPTTTYYQWDASPAPGDPSWNIYSAPFNAPEGQHTLNYYSVDTAGNAEAVQSQLSKVDTAVPSAPTLSGSSPSSSQIDLSWNPSTDNVGVAGYNIYDANTNALLATTSATSYSFTGLLPDTTYRYYAKAYDLAGNLSGPSNTASIRTQSRPSPPPNPEASPRSSSRIDLSWGDSTPRADIVGYRIERSPDGLTSWTEIGTSSTTSYSDLGLTSSTDHYYRMKAYTSGETSDPSSIVSAKTYAMASVLPARDVTVNLENQVSLTFKSIDSVGTVTVEVPDTVPPANFGFPVGKDPLYFEIKTNPTGIYSGPVLVALPYDELAKPKVMHYESGKWENVTIPLKGETLPDPDFPQVTVNPDTVKKIIYGKVTTLSPFAVVEPAGYTRTEESSSSVTKTGTWITKTDPSHSGTTQIISNTLGDSVSFTFEGTGISWLSSRYYNRGHGKVYIDGIFQQEVDLYSSGTWQAQKPVFTKTGLVSGIHTISIEVAPKSSFASDNWCPVDGFDVFNDLTRVEEDSPSVTKTGTWTTKTDGSHSGATQIISNTLGDSVSYTFTGTSIQWVSSRYSNRGKAKVYVDDLYQQEIDLYSTGSWLAQQVVFTKTNLSAGTHTIRIEVSGKNPASGGPWGDGWVPIDGFDTSDSLTRTEEDSPSITYTGSWTTQTDGSLSGTTQRVSNTIGDTATFTFTGDSVALVTSKLANRGHGKIYIDGIFQQEIDPYSSGYLQPQDVSFTETGLGAGTHTIRVEVAPKSSWATDNYIAIDAFDVR